MVRKFKLETANVTLTSQLTKNSTTNRFKVRAMFKIALCCSTLYRQSFMIRKILFVFTSYGQDDRRNEKQYLIFYSKSVIVPSPLVLSNASSVAHSTVRKPISEITLLVRPTSPSVDINILLGSLTTSVPSPVRSTVALSSSVVRETDKPPVTGEIMLETDGHDLFKLYEDLFLTENERVSMFREGIQSVDLSKISCSAGDKKKSGVAKENKLNDVYQNKHRIHWILRFLKIMEPSSKSSF
nr:uncharacterized protein LOC131771903 isoform X2 [Pocillopora verrucosa]